MPLLSRIKKFVNSGLLPGHKNAEKAYDLWSENYDNQPGNLMLDFDEEIFTKLLDKTAIENRTVADMGCGTGRHWKKILDKNPESLTGYDVSEGMLGKLRKKYPGALTNHLTSDTLPKIPTASYDTIISTLTIAHIQNIEETFHEWCRILKNTGEIIITDFHPDALQRGSRRTFSHGNKTVVVKNYIHSLNRVKDILSKHGFYFQHEEVRCPDDRVKHYYEKQNALQAFERFKNIPVIYGILLKRRNDIK